MFSNTNSLRGRVNGLIKENHPRLFLSLYKNAFEAVKNELSSSSAWRYVVGAIITVSICGLVLDFDVLNIIPINVDTAQKIIDQRASNIATIMSITLVVVGFLMNNIAMKESFSYQLLFKRSYFYPIVYLVLSTIAYFFVISILRDSMSEFHFVRLVLIGTYLAIFILFVIGYLFKSIIQFTNSENIVALLHDEVISEAKINLRKVLFREYATDLYRKIMQDSGCIEYSLADAWSNINFASSISFDTMNSKVNGDDNTEVEIEDKTLYDINLEVVKKFVDKKLGNGRLMFKGLTLGMLIPATGEYYIWTRGEENSALDKKELNKMLVLKDAPSISVNDVSSPREYLDHKLEEWSSDNKSKRLDQLLKIYRELYEMEMQNVKSIDNA